MSHRIMLIPVGSGVGLTSVSLGLLHACQQKGIKVGHITFPDEGHGFRKAANIIRAMESELDFYTDVFDLANKNSKSA